MDAINAGLSGLNTPLGQLGTNLLSQSGPQQGNPGGGQRLGAALAGMSEQQRQQALQQYRNAQIQQAQDQHAFQLKQYQDKADQQQRQQQAMQNPDLQAQLGPMARQMAQAGIDPSLVLKANGGDALQAYRDAMLQQQQAQMHQSASQFQQAQAGLDARHADGQTREKLPSPRQVLEEPLDNGMIQRHIYDAATGAYKPYGKPYHQYAPPKANPLDALLGGEAPDDNAGQGPAVPGLPGSNASMTPPPQGADLLMYGSGSNPTARKAPAAQGPATPTSKAEYDALPAGAQYIDPATGRVATKKAR